jgi:CRP/FNR family transcriptional regulator, cyclic AMP receptor protein
MLPVHEIIAGHPFLSDLPDHIQKILTAHASLTQFKPNEVIFHEGEEANCFYLIGSGSVAIEVFVPGHGRVVLLTLDEGSVLGWSWLFPPYRWHFDGRAINETLAVVIHVENLRQLLASDPELDCVLVRRFADVIIQRLQAARLRFAELYDPPK